MSILLTRWLFAVALLNFALANFAYMFWVTDWGAVTETPSIYGPLKIATFLSLVSIPAAWACRSEAAIRIFVGWFFALAVTHAAVFFLIAFAKPAIG